MLADYSSPPFPADPAEWGRWEHTRRRERMLSGRWHPDLESRLVDHFGIEVRGAIGPKSLAKNILRKLCSELAVSYIEKPKVTHAAGEVTSLLGAAGILQKMGLWALMRHVQRRLVGLREMLLRVDWSPLLGRPAVRPVRPDVVCAWATPEDPHSPIEVHELRWREVPGKARWCWDVLSIADPAEPSFRIHEVDSKGGLGPDLTQEVLGRTYTGAAYPYRWTEGARSGRPFLPYVMYHAMRSGVLWDTYEGIEVVEGALDVATAYTFLQSDIFHASWPQRWALGAYVVGTVPVAGAGGTRTKVPASPLSVIHFEGAPGVANPQIGQWNPGIDVESLARTVGMLERATAEFDGLDMSFIVKDTANPWSAAALSITREGKRQAQRTYAAELEPSDLETIEKIAAIANLMAPAGAEHLPEEGYAIEYTSLPLSADEAQARRDANAEKLGQGRKSVVDVYLDDHPEKTREQAEADLARIADENKRWMPSRATSTPASAPAGA